MLTWTHLRPPRPTVVIYSPSILASNRGIFVTDGLILFPQLLRLFWDGCFDLQVLSGLFFKDVNVPGSTVVPMPEMDTSFSLRGERGWRLWRRHA